MPPYASVENLQRLRVYQLARELSKLVWQAVKEWNFETRKHLGDQWVRATDSISANIAEGYGRFFFNDSIKFYYYARGSLFEFYDWLAKAQERGLLTEQQSQALKAQSEDLPKELNTLIKRTRTNSQHFVNNKSINQ